MSSSSKVQGPATWVGHLDAGNISPGRLLLYFSQSSEHYQLLIENITNGIALIETSPDAGSLAGQMSTPPDLPHVQLEEVLTGRFWDDDYSSPGHQLMPGQFERPYPQEFWWY